MRTSLLVSFCLLLSALANAQPSGRQWIESFYEGLTMAAEMKFADAMVSHRSSGFVGKDEKGLSRTTWGDLERFRRLFSESISVHCRNKMLKFSQDGGVIRCTVEQHWSYSRREASVLPKLLVVREKWLLEDSWELKSGDWELVNSLIVKRSVPEW